MKLNYDDFMGLRIAHFTYVTLDAGYTKHKAFDKLEKQEIEEAFTAAMSGFFGMEERLIFVGITVKLNDLKEGDEVELGRHECLILRGFTTYLLAKIGYVTDKAQEFEKLLEDTKHRDIAVKAQVMDTISSYVSNQVIHPDYLEGYKSAMLKLKEGCYAG